MTTLVENGNFDDLCTEKYPSIAVIKTLTNKSLVCRMDFNKVTVGNIIKNLIDKIGYKATNINSDEINFVHNKKKWCDRDKTLKELGCIGKLVKLEMYYNMICNKKKEIDVNNIRQKVYSSNKIVKIKTLTGKVINIKFIDDLTCEELKVLIWEEIGMPADMQRLIFRGLQLEDAKMLKDYDMYNEASIHLVSRLRGGMFHETSGKNGNYKPLEFTIIDIDPYEDLNHDAKN